MHRRVSNKFIFAAVAALASIIIAVIAYSLIGIYVNTNNVRIYDEFPEEFFCYPSNPEEKLLCDINIIQLNI